MLLNAFPNSARTFRDIVPALSKSPFVIAPDLPGYIALRAPERVLVSSRRMPMPILTGLGPQWNGRLPFFDLAETHRWRISGEWERTCSCYWFLSPVQ
jgi:hypothetical protein